MNNKFQNFKTKLQENRKFQIQFVSVVAACVVVLACAITIPVAVHNNNIKKAMTEEVENSTADIAVTEEISEPETTANEATTLADETLTTAAPTSAIADIENKTTPSGNNTSNGGGSGNKGGSSGSSNNKPTTTEPVTTTKKETTTKDDDWNWTQADVDSAVAKARQYAKSKGYTIDTSLTEVGTSWTALDTRYDSKQVVAEDTKYLIDRLYAADIAEWGQIDSRFTLNVFSKNCGGYWEIYVVY